jgi:exosortase
MNKLPPNLSFVVLCGVSLVLWFRPLVDTFALASEDSKYTHIILILPIVIALIFQGWKVGSAEPRFWLPAGGLSLISLLVAGGARWGSRSDLGLTIEMAGLVSWWVASFVFCFGPRAFRSFCFPLLFLFWMVPLPETVLDPIIAGLQHWSTLAAQLLFWISRVPVSRDATTLLIPGLEIDVTAECSSIRSSMMLVVTTMVLSYVLVRTPWRRALVIALAIPLSIAKNGLRIFVIATLGTRVDETFLTGRFHHQGGIVFFLIALAVMFLILWMMRRGEQSLRGQTAFSDPTSVPLPPG